MKKFYFVLIFSLAPIFNSHSQDLWFKSICNCFKNIEYSNNFDDTKSQVEKCVKKKSKKFSIDLVSFFEESNNSLHFIKKIGQSCPEFYEFAVKFELDDESTSDEERYKIIDDLAAYFSYPIDKGKIPSNFRILPKEQGILFNSYFNRLYPDSLFNEGIHTLPFYDSLIIFDLNPQRLNTKLELKLDDHALPKMELTYIAQLKKEKVGHLLKNFGYDYHKTLLIPELRNSTRKALEKLSINDLIKLSKE